VGTEPVPDNNAAVSIDPALLVVESREKGDVDCKGQAGGVGASQRDGGDLEKFIL
jgi:hypothetical protein